VRNGPPGERAQANEEDEEHDPRGESSAPAETGFDEEAVGEDEQEGAERGDAEQRGNLVERGLVDQVLVAVVQAEGLAQEDEQRRHSEGGPRDSTAVEQDAGDDECQRDREHVGHAEGAPESRIPADELAPPPQEAGGLRRGCDLRGFVFERRGRFRGGGWMRRRLHRSPHRCRFHRVPLLPLTTS
jgi:hypothetical protein